MLPHQGVVVKQAISAKNAESKPWKGHGGAESGHIRSTFGILKASGDGKSNSMPELK
jgi:hypothetical protein